ncbi:MAG: LysR family transcriptional regulator [Betaproteobacteria bacterium]|nr:LysR family transcriptional regulator [Betaproteobacteria bacterium]
MAAHSPMEVRLRLMCGDEIALGPGKIKLLRLIDETGSISAAARAAGMSYRRAWLLVETMNACFTQPLVATETGGAKGGGAKVTDLGREVATLYAALDLKAAAAIADDVGQLHRHLRRRDQL